MKISSEDFLAIAKGDMSTFYIDETVLELEGKKHILLAALSFLHGGSVAEDISRLKIHMGLKPTTEVKWNSDALKKDQRIAYQEGLLRALSISSARALVSVVEGKDKQRGAEIIANQIASFVKAENISSYSLFYDKGLVPDIGKLAEKFMQKRVPICASIQEFDSSRDQLLQCSDILAGLLKLTIQHVAEGKERMIFIGNDRGEGSYVPFDFYILMNARWMLDGVAYEQNGFPFKDVWDRGLIFKSTISSEIKSRIREGCGKVYLGCTS